jgi:hypothetical protein
MSDERYVWGRIADPAMAMASESAASGMEAVKVMVEAVMVAEVMVEAVMVAEVMVEAGTNVDY